MEFCWFVLLAWCASLAHSFDLGPIVRIAQCRSQCLRKHSGDGTCDWFSSRGETVCSECWQNCEALENQWEDTKSICGGDQYLRCPACQTACIYRKTRVEEQYLPSMLPAPKKGPISLDKFDVAVVMRRVHKQWQESGYYPGGRAPTLRPDTWIIVVVEDGLKHYSWQEWVPTLDSLKAGALYEATITWKDVQTQLKKQRELEQKRFNDRVRQFFLEKYGEKVLSEWRSHDDSKMSEDVFRRFFFRRKDDLAEKPLETETSPSTGNSYLEGADGNEKSNHAESYVVSWEPITGGLMGNQVADSDSAQISLLPGTKYLVRIASNDGPGSFPIEVDTRPGSVQIQKIKQSLPYLYYWDIVAAVACAVFVLLILIVAKIVRRKSKEVTIGEEV